METDVALDDPDAIPIVGSDSTVSYVAARRVTAGTRDDGLTLPGVAS